MKTEGQVYLETGILGGYMPEKVKKRKLDRGGCCTSKQIACSGLFLFAVFEFDLENYLSVCGNQRYL